MRTQNKMMAVQIVIDTAAGGGDCTRPIVVQAAVGSADL